MEVIKISADEISLFAENLINTVREPLICLDQDLRVMSVSRSFYEFFNVKPEDTMGELIYNLGNKQWDIPKLRELLEEILPEENTFNGYEVEHNFTTIGRRVMLLNAREIIQASGKKKIILLAIEDITERKDMEKELQLTEEMMLIQSKQAAMGNMISMIAHQWRQPLTVMSMDANNLIMSIALEEELSTDYLLQFGNDLLAHIQQLSKTIDDFRDFFKPDQSKEKMIIEDVLNDTLKIIGTSLSNNNIALNIKNPSKSSLYINKSSFIQVLLNIIGNAKDILLEKEVSKATISINVNETKEVITISICDNGGGIPEAIIGKIGQPYLTTKEKLNGTGLGIYISLTIVKKHMNGTLTWHNEEQGACFVITLNKEKSIKNN